VVAPIDPTPWCGVPYTGDPPPAESTDSARVPSVSFQGSDAMNDPPVSIPVVNGIYDTFCPRRYVTLRNAGLAHSVLHSAPAPPA